ncbi:MAG: polyprenyl synthetase family protein [Spirochaetota bacterium]
MQGESTSHGSDLEEFNQEYQKRKAAFATFLQESIFSAIHTSFHPTLAEASVYTLSSGGKRLRPTLVLSAYLASAKTDGISQAAFAVAAAVECIHTYSLVHDDLPAMDNDDYRRGKPSCHKKFGEAVAILVGDALQAYGFYLLAQVTSDTDVHLHQNLLQILYAGAGAPGMISGQMLDIASENQTSQFSPELLESIHSQKTGALIVSSLLLGNRLSVNWLEKETKFREYGEKLGLLFQLTDDILDEESSLSTLGKTPGKDAAMGKLTYPALYGMEKSKQMASELSEELVILGQLLDEKSAEAFLSQLPVYIFQRSH